MQWLPVLSAASTLALHNLFSETRGRENISKLMPFLTRSCPTFLSWALEYPREVFLSVSSLPLTSEVLVISKVVPRLLPSHLLPFSLEISVEMRFELISPIPVLSTLKTLPKHHFIFFHFTFLHSTHHHLHRYYWLMCLWFSSPREDGPRKSEILLLVCLSLHSQCL